MRERVPVGVRPTALNLGSEFGEIRNNERSRTSLAGRALAVFFGACTGTLIAFRKVPAIFATLATGSVIYGAGRTWFFQLEMQAIPAGIAFFDFVGQGHITGSPVTIVVFLVFCIAGASVSEPYPDWPNFVHDGQ